MTPILSLLSWMRNPVQSIDIDAASAISLHQATLKRNPLLRSLYHLNYAQFKPAYEAVKKLNLPAIELGCGPSFLNEYIPEIIKSDIVIHPNVQRYIDAQRLPFPDNSLSAIFMTNVLHHLSIPANFLKEAQRTLAPGGVLMMIEPSNSFLQRTITNLGSPYEYSDPSVKEWHNSNTGRYSHANNSLAWIIFERDRKRFAAEFPHLELKEIGYQHHLTFYFSGGFHYRPFIPRLFHFLIPQMEKTLRPFRRLLNRWTPFEMVIQIQKR